MGLDGRKGIKGGGGEGEGGLEDGMEKRERMNINVQNYDRSEEGTRKRKAFVWHLQYSVT